ARTPGATLRLHSFLTYSPRAGPTSARLVFETSPVAEAPADRGPGVLGPEHGRNVAVPRPCGGPDRGAHRVRLRQGPDARPSVRPGSPVAKPARGHRSRSRPGVPGHEAGPGSPVTKRRVGAALLTEDRADLRHRFGPPRAQPEQRDDTDD